MLCHVLELHVQRLRQQHTEAPGRQGDDAVDDHGDGVMVDGEQPYERSQDAGHSGTHGVQTHAVLSADAQRRNKENSLLPVSCCGRDLHGAPRDI